MAAIGVDVGSRLRAVVVAALLLAVMGGFPGLAGADPRTVTVATHDLEPFVMTHNDIKSGFTIDILDAIAKRAGWTLNYVEAEGVVGELKAVSEGRADAAAGAISITADRALDYDFSQPTLNAGLQILVPTGQNQRTSAGLVDFLKLMFSKAILVWLATALLITVIPAHIVWLIERRHSHSMVSKDYFPGIFQALGWGLGMLAAQPENFPRHWFNRTFAVFLAFVSIVFVAYYTATLTANLTVEKFNSKISSPSDLFGRSVCTVANTTSAAFLRTLGVTYDAAPQIDDCFTGVKGGKFEAVVFDAPVLHYFAAHEGAGTAELAGAVFQSEDYGVAFRNGNELRKQFDEALLSIREDGTYDLIKGKWFGTDGSGAGG